MTLLLGGFRTLMLMALSKWTDTAVDKDHTLSEVQAGNQAMIKRLYDQFRSEFITWSQKSYGLQDDKAIELYQQSFTAFYYNVRERKITQLESSIKTYLFAIGKNKIRDHFKKSQRNDESLDEHHHIGVDAQIMSKYESVDLSSKVKFLLNRIGEPCQTVLKLYYFEHYSMESIASRMNYKSENVAAKRKFTCLKQLRTMLSQG
ncbi:MAG: sigma-70 family RNA polymerase sigma factor [Saprospiraceae bacterium]|nr:sigma-70 family RNA polymerase sigma factor [Saprospiraceae bacterium]